MGGGGGTMTLPPWLNLFVRPEQLNFLFFENLGQKLKIRGWKKIKTKVNVIH